MVCTYFIDKCVGKYEQMGEGKKERGGEGEGGVKGTPEQRLLEWPQETGHVTHVRWHVHVRTCAGTCKYLLSLAAEPALQLAQCF